MVEVAKGLQASHKVELACIGKGSVIKMSVSDLIRSSASLEHRQVVIGTTGVDRERLGHPQEIFELHDGVLERGAAGLRDYSAR